LVDACAKVGPSLASTRRGCIAAIDGQREVKANRRPEWTTVEPLDRVIGTSRKSRVGADQFAHLSARPPEAVSGNGLDDLEVAARLNGRWKIRRKPSRPLQCPFDLAVERELSLPQGNEEFSFEEPRQESRPEGPLRQTLVFSARGDQTAVAPLEETCVGRGQSRQIECRNDGRGRTPGCQEGGRHEPTATHAQLDTAAGEIVATRCLF
jgi:hypothetical protein